MNLSTLAELLGTPCHETTAVGAVSIDSRTLKPGDLFVAIAGDRFDGHDYLQQAAANGAIAAVVEKPCAALTIPQFIVPSTVAALGVLARHHRQTIHCPVIALTGSNGKTSVKEMIAAILPQPSFATPGNRNNHLGVPLSVMDLSPRHRYAVFELGANHAGEIAYTVAMVQPDVALINNIAPAHIEGFGSIEGVARAKGEIYQGLSAQGGAVVNDDDGFAHFWDPELAGKKTLRFSLARPVDIYARDLTYDAQHCAYFTIVVPGGNAPVALQVPGEHSVRNALAAAACCVGAGIALDDIVQGLNRFRGVAGRMTYLAGKNQSVVIDDSYNANLNSVLTAVEVLAQRPGQRILVLGDLGELGSFTRQHHEEIGLVARNKGIDLLLTCGKNSEYTSKTFGEPGRHYSSHDALAEDLLTKLDPSTTVLVKGSRSAAMEKIVHRLI